MLYSENNNYRLTCQIHERDWRRPSENTLKYRAIKIFTYEEIVEYMGGLDRHPEGVDRSFLREAVWKSSKKAMIKSGEEGCIISQVEIHTEGELNLLGEPKWFIFLSDLNDTDDFLWVNMKID